MVSIQCPICKGHIGLDLDISMKARGLIVFRGRIVFLGNLKDVGSLLAFIRESFRHCLRIPRHVLIEKLVRVCGIPYSDACHFVEQFQQEGFLYEPVKDELEFIG